MLFTIHENKLKRKPNKLAFVKQMQPKRWNRTVRDWPIYSTALRSTAYILTNQRQ